MQAMFKSGAWLLAPFLIASPALRAQDGPATPEELQAVDKITAVPAPEIEPGGGINDGLTMPENLNISNDGGTISGNIETGVRFSGPVKITGDNGLEAFARSAVLDLKAKTVTLEGDVTVYQGDLLQRGERAVYHYETKTLDATGLRASVDPLLLEAGKFTSVRSGERQVFIGKDAGITTHDVEEPNFWLRAKETRVYPGEKIVFKNLLAYAGEVPVFWFPYLAQPLDSELGYHFLPGSKSGWGPYLLNTYGIMLGGETDPLTGDTHDEWLLSKWHFDLMATRGLGLGLDLADIRQERNNDISGLSLYYLHDQDPTFSRSGVTRRQIDSDRYNIQLKQRYLFDPADDADWRLDINLSHYSDEYYLEDLDEDFYRDNPAPDNTIGVFRRDDRSLTSIFTRYQINDFYRSDTRLPEITYDAHHRPLLDIPGFDQPLLHETIASIGYIGERAADGTSGSIINPLSQLNIGDPDTGALLNELSGYERALAEEMISLPLGDPRREKIRRQLNDARYTRLHLYEQLSMPFMIGDALSLTPQVGAGYTRYTSIDGPAEGFGRMMAHAGLEASMKFSKDYGEIHNHTLGVHGLMHVFQPYVNWSVIATDDYQPGDPGVDRLSPTTRPRMLDPMRYSAIDQMESWNIVRIGARNRLITQRDGQSFSWLYLNTYLDAFADDPEGERNWSNLYNDASWQPTPWMSFDVETQFPLADGGSGFSEFNSRARFMPCDDFEFSIGYRWLNGHPFLYDSSRIDLQTYTRITENWGFGTRHGLEMDDGTIEYQQYSVHRDLGNWVAGTGLMLRDNRIKDEYGLIFTLTLKDFPSVSLPFGYDAQ